MKRNNEVIEIYPSVWKTLGLILICGIFVIAGWLVIHLPPRHGSWFQIFIGYSAMAFFSFGIITGFGWIVLKAMRRPMAKIYPDRIECFEGLTYRHYVIPFTDIQIFHMIQNGTKIIRADYFTGGGRNTSIIGSLVCNLNKICELLNERLEHFRRQPMLNTTLTPDSLTRHLDALGISRNEYAFYNVRHPDSLAIVKSGCDYQVVYVDDRGIIENKASLSSEPEACGYLLEYFLRQKNAQSPAQD